MNKRFLTFFSMIALFTLINSETSQINTKTLQTKNVFRRTIDKTGRFFTSIKEKINSTWLSLKNKISGIDKKNDQIKKESTLTHKDSDFLDKLDKELSDEKIKQHDRVKFARKLIKEAKVSAQKAKTETERAHQKLKNEIDELRKDVDNTYSTVTKRSLEARTKIDRAINEAKEALVEALKKI
jgi:hypothetical protein